MTNDERDKAIFDLSAAFDRFDDRFFALQSCFVVALCASALMIFLVVWFGGVNITIINEPSVSPATVGEANWSKRLKPSIPKRRSERRKADEDFWLFSPQKRAEAGCLEGLDDVQPLPRSRFEALRRPRSPSRSTTSRKRRRRRVGLGLV